MTPAEFRAARLAMGLEQTELAAMMDVSTRTIVARESNGGMVPGVYALAMDALSATLTQSQVLNDKWVRTLSRVIPADCKDWVRTPTPEVAAYLFNEMTSREGIAWDHVAKSRAETAAAEARGMRRAADKLRLVGKDEYTNDFNRGFDLGIEWSRNTILAAIPQGDTTND